MFRRQIISAQKFDDFSDQRITVWWEMFWSFLRLYLPTIARPSTVRCFVTLALTSHILLHAGVGSLLFKVRTPPESSSSVSDAPILDPCNTIFTILESTCLITVLRHVDNPVTGIMLSYTIIYEKWRFRRFS